VGFPYRHDAYTLIEHDAVQVRPFSSLFLKYQSFMFSAASLICVRVFHPIFGLFRCCYLRFLLKKAGGDSSSIGRCGPLGRM
jgi:hypothetical protein